jgi:hypothetical protein
MTKNPVWLWFATLVVALLGAGCVAEPARDDESSVAAFLQQIVTARDDAMLTGDVTTYETYFAPGAWPSANPLMNEYDPAILAGMRARMIEQGTDIVDLASTTTITSIDAYGDVLTVRFTIESSMQVSVAGRVLPEPSRSRGEYRAVLQREDAQLLITSFDLDYGDTPMLIESDVPTATDLGIAPTLSSDDIDFDAPTPLVYYSNSAAAYSDRWAMGSNSAYWNLASFWPGGDCTNFVSQALQAGGRTYSWGPQNSDSAWWYNTSFTCTRDCWSYSWAGARNLWANLIATPAGASVGRVEFVRAGDLIFADWNRPDGLIDHVMIVSQRICSGSSWSCVQINQHTPNRYRQAMSTTIAMSPGASFYTVRPVF